MKRRSFTMKGQHSYAKNPKSKTKAMNGPLTPTPDVGHGIKGRGGYSSNRIPDRVAKVGSGGKSKNPF